MRKEDVKMDGVYLARVSGKLVKVRVISVSDRGGWWVQNQQTKRMVHAKTAARLRPLPGSDITLLWDAPKGFYWAVANDKPITMSEAEVAAKAAKPGCGFWTTWATLAKAKPNTPISYSEVEAGKV